MRKSGSGRLRLTEGVVAGEEKESRGLISWASEIVCRRGLSRVERSKGDDVDGAGLNEEQGGGGGGAGGKGQGCASSELEFDALLLEATGSAAG